MKKAFLITILSVLTLVPFSVTALDTSSQAKQNLQITRHYYSKLIADPQVQLAELKMVMTMMPKGGDIHHHYSGSIYAETYLDWVGQQGFCIYRESDAANKHTKYHIETKKIAVSETSPSCIKADAIRQDALFYRELISAWSAGDFDNHVHQQLAPDQHFFNTFVYFSSISKYSTNQGLKILRQQAKAENQQYIETMLKSAPVTDHPQFSAQIDQLQNDASEEQMTQAFAQFADFLSKDNSAQKKITDYMQEIERDVSGVDDADFTLRIQTYVSRNSAPSKVFSGLFSAFSASNENPLIVGVNIVGAEHAVVALRDYQLHMKMLAFLKKRFPKVHLSLHAGELVLGITSPKHLQFHMRSAMQVAGAERIGHGVDIMHEANPDQLLVELKKRNVAIEINLTSNAFILGLKEQLHPVTMYLRHQVPIVISSDDAGVSRNNLSQEYFLFTSRYKPSYDTLKKTVYNSIQYAFLNDEDKKKNLSLLDKRFVQFEAAVANLARSTTRKK